jgi:hypothetical protein
MTLKRKLATVVAVAVLGASVFAAMPANAAEESASAPISVNVICDQTPTIGLTVAAPGFGDWNPITDGLSKSTAPDAITINVNTGCNFNPWQVDISATPFTTPGHVPFSAQHLAITNADVESSTLSDSTFGIIPEPEPSNATFTFFGEGSNPVLATRVLWFFELIDIPAPFETTATYGAKLTFDSYADLLLVGEHTYSSTLTVTLTTDL